MPVALLVNKVTDHLSTIDYRKPNDCSTLTVHQTLKEFISTGNSFNIKIQSNRLFEITISTAIYSNLLAADYFFSEQKINYQKKCIESFKEKSLPLSWLIVTLYYGCFYSAIQVLRLTGTYCSYFSKQECEDIRNFSENSLSLEPGNYIGSIDSDNGYIKLNFRKSNLGSHELVWDSVKNLINSFDLTTVPSKKVNKIQFLTDVFKSKIVIDFPNIVRNRWNYSKSDSYSPSNDIIFGKFRACLLDLSHALNLESSYKKNDKELNEILFIWTINCFLESTLNNVKLRILPT